MEVLNLELLVEVENGSHPSYTATVPRFRLYAGDEPHRVMGRGQSPGAALRHFADQLDEVCRPPKSTDTIKAEPLERIEGDPDA